MKKTFGLGMLARMHRYLKNLTALAACLLLAGCGTLRSSVVVEPAAGGGTYIRPNTLVAPARTPIPGGSYTVLKGDTLYSIAFRNGVDFRDLAQWNRIAVPYTIWPGQHLVLSPGVAAVASSGSVASAAAQVVPVITPTAPAAQGFEPITSPAAAVGNPPSAAPPSAAPPIAVPSNVTVPPSGVGRPSVPSTAAIATQPVVAHPTVAPPPLPIRPATAATTASNVIPVAGTPVAPPLTIPPVATPAVAGPSRAVNGVHWRWPADGKLASRFQSGDAIPGIEIAGKSGDSVRAAADGVVVYSGNGLVGYGELVIIKHNDSFLSAYGHNRKRLVKEGQRVSAGQQIAEMGSTGATRDELEFQIRKDGNPVDPLGYLPPR